MDAFNSKSLVKFSSEINDQIQAIKEGVLLLYNNEMAKKELADKIIIATKKLGPYYVIAPNIALLHSEPGKESIKPCLSLLVTKNIINFGFEKIKKRKARIIFTLSAPDGISHMNIIKKFAKKLQDKSLVQSLLKVNSQNDLIRTLNL